LFEKGSLDPLGIHWGFIMAASCFLGRCEAIKEFGRVKKRRNKRGKVIEVSMSKELSAKEHAVMRFIEEVFKCQEEIRARCEQEGNS